MLTAVHLTVAADFVRDNPLKDSLISLMMIYLHSLLQYTANTSIIIYVLCLKWLVLLFGFTKV